MGKLKPARYRGDDKRAALMICRECGHEPERASSFTRSSLPHLCPVCDRYAMRPQLANWPEVTPGGNDATL